MLKTVQTAVKILNLFSLQKPEWRVSEVSKALNLPLSSTSKLLTSLASENLLSHTPSRSYELSERITELSRVMLDTSEYFVRTQNALQDLASRLKENLYLTRLDGTRVILIEKFQLDMELQRLLSKVGPGFRFIPG